MDYGGVGPLPVNIRERVNNGVRIGCSFAGSFSEPVANFTRSVSINVGCFVQAGSRVGFLPLSLSHHTKW